MDQIAMLEATLARYRTDSQRPRSWLIEAALPETPARGKQPPAWCVTGQDVVAAMAAASGHIGVMNFASPTRPGGGVELGARAQEESIAKATYLLPALREFDQTYYAANRAAPNGGLFSATLIYTARCRQCFDAAGRPLSAHFVDVVTVAAPNRAAYPGLSERDTEPDLAFKILQTLRAFKQQGATYLILGAFGTGVFANPIAQVGRLFGTALRRPEFHGAFDAVEFAVFDRAGDRRQAFAAALGTSID
ncbi:TIGR02452 family protein [Lacticaseibacillus parakribbianus]|uniref:TIGR02452 family protein n=1 Tax=Lacticaseibacillus parakribbianus TaxID=2970927 RepID=UPI0021CAF4CC|nr:TIGR02452 family protein [Lacticaseibacillus parakribbianus]